MTGLMIRDVMRGSNSSGSSAERVEHVPFVYEHPISAGFVMTARLRTAPQGEGMKNFYNKVPGKREFLFDDKELVILTAGALLIGTLLFALGVMVGQTWQTTTVASPLTADSAPLEAVQDNLLTSNESGEMQAVRETSAENTDAASSAANDGKRGSYRVLPDSDTYVEENVTPTRDVAKETVQEPVPADPPQVSANAPAVQPAPAQEDVPVPPTDSAKQPEPAVAQGAQNVAVAPALPNVPKDATDEIRLGRQTQRAQTNAPMPEGTIFSVQVASSSKQEDAERLVQKFTQQGFQAFVMTADLGEKGIWYRVRVGNLTTRPEAEKMKAEIVAKLPNLAKSPYIIKVNE